MNEKIHMDAVYTGAEVILDPRPRQFFDARRGRFCPNTHIVRLDFGPVRIQVAATFDGDQFTGLGRFFLQ